ncbi:MAG: 50S ribosomal protein L21 [Actinomycetota bacterium]|nr:50S ribosomal protein L21 [Actinomycetota bacterium]
MYAVIRTGSKQYRVSPGDALTIEKLEAKQGAKLRFKDVILFHDGKDLIYDPKKLARVQVKGQVIEQGPGEKLVVYKYHPKKGYARKRGHRQKLSRVRIDEITYKPPETKKREKEMAKE